MESCSNRHYKKVTEDVLTLSTAYPNKSWTGDSIICSVSDFGQLASSPPTFVAFISDSRGCSILAVSYGKRYDEVPGHSKKIVSKSCRRSGCQKHLSVLGWNVLERKELTSAALDSSLGFYEGNRVIGRIIYVPRERRGLFSLRSPQGLRELASTITA
jgi:hypothetical protein